MYWFIKSYETFTLHQNHAEAKLPKQLETPWQVRSQGETNALTRSHTPRNRPEKEVKQKKPDAKFYCFKVIASASRFSNTKDLAITRKYNTADAAAFFFSTCAHGYVTFTTH